MSQSRETNLRAANVANKITDAHDVTLKMSRFRELINAECNLLEIERIIKKCVKDDILLNEGGNFVLYNKIKSILENKE